MIILGAIFILYYSIVTFVFLHQVCQLFHKSES